MFVTNCALVSGIKEVSKESQISDSTKAIIYGCVSTNFVGASNVRVFNLADRSKHNGLYFEVNGPNYFVFQLEPSSYIFLLEKMQTFGNGESCFQTLYATDCVRPEEYSGADRFRFKGGHIYYLGYIGPDSDKPKMEFDSLKISIDGWVKKKYSSFPFQKVEESLVRQ